MHDMDSNNSIHDHNIKDWSKLCYDATLGWLSRNDGTNVGAVLKFNNLPVYRLTVQPSFLEQCFGISRKPELKTYDLDQVSITDQQSILQSPNDTCRHKLIELLDQIRNIEAKNNNEFMEEVKMQLKQKNGDFC